MTRRNWSNKNVCLPFFHLCVPSDFGSKLLISDCRRLGNPLLCQDVLYYSRSEVKKTVQQIPSCHYEIINSLQNVQLNITQHLISFADSSKVLLNRELTC